MPDDEEKITELRAIVAAVRDRVRNGHGESGNGPDATGASPAGVRVFPADLMPLVRARDAAQAKIAAIGSVNPRAAGLLNRLIQAIKKLVARSLQWFVRDQIVFNRQSVTATEAVIEALNEQNRALLLLGSQIADINSRFPRMLEEAREMKDIRTHWIEWRAAWERNLAANEIQFLRSVADLQGAFQHRVSLLEANFRETVQAQHRDYLGALDRANLDIQQRLWANFEKVRETFEKTIHSELRLIRLRSRVPSGQLTGGVAPAPPAHSLALDYSRFADRFRGSDEEVRRNMEFYRTFFTGLDNVLDIGCGRGEFLELMRDAGVTARGIDLSEEAVAQCRNKGLEAEVADLFVYLASQPEGEFDGILSSQLVEHLPADRVPEMISLCSARLRRGGVLAIETPNPECLAIFATYFYLDPTHTRPMPHEYLRFCMEEAGFAAIEVHQLSPAIDTIPEVAELPADFRKRFFGGLDYAIIGRKS